MRGEAPHDGKHWEQVLPQRGLACPDRLPPGTSPPPGKGTLPTPGLPGVRPARASGAGFGMPTRGDPSANPEGRKERRIIGARGQGALRAQTHRASTSGPPQGSRTTNGRGCHAVVKPWLMDRGPASAFLPHLANYAAVLARGPE